MMPLQGSWLAVRKWWERRSPETQASLLIVFWMLALFVVYIS